MNRNDREQVGHVAMRQGVCTYFILLRDKIIINRLCCGVTSGQHIEYCNKYQGLLSTVTTWLSFFNFCNGKGPLSWYMLVLEDNRRTC